MRLPPIVALAAVVAGAAVPSACGGGSDPERGCGPTTREALDPQFLIHVVSDEGLAYTTDPPTSGPHQPSPAIDGVLTEPLPRPVQVGVLEAGDVLLQHRGDLAADELDELRALAGDRVVIAPNPDLDHAVVATAWLHKRTCRSVDADALRDFIRARRGKGPDVEDQ